MSDEQENLPNDQDLNEMKNKIILEYLESSPAMKQLKEKFQKQKPRELNGIENSGAENSDGESKPDRT